MPLNYLLLIIVTCSTCGKMIFCKLVGVKNDSDTFFLFNFKSFFFAFILSLVFYANELPQLFAISPFSLLFSFLFAFFVFSTQFMQIKAMKAGPTALTTLICACAFLIPIFYSAIFYSERISVFQIIGIAILLVAISLIVFEKNQTSINFKWFFLAIIAMLCGGITAITQKVHQLSEFSYELDLLLIYGFFFSSVFALIGHLITNKFQFTKKEGAEKTSFKTWLKKNYSALVLGLIAFGNSFINFFLSGKIPSVIHFPVSNVGSLMLTYALSSVIFKEKLSAKQKIGGIIGVCAILIIGLC